MKKTLKMNFKISITFVLLTLLIFSCNDLKVSNNKSDNIIQVEYPETYELANIILALTDYGKTDKWEVRQDFEYYEKVQEYFEPVSNHPLLDSVNYSRKRWKEYLSFRTDSYAFTFDKNNNLKRNINFYANDGVNPFDNHLGLINDFIEKSNFRAFFTQNKEYYTNISEKYEKTQYLKEMRDFLISEFGEQFSIDTKYKIILSPFVYRMNCHRDIDSTITADFIAIPEYVLTDSISVKEKDIATNIHILFTEMDHGYVNPATKKWNGLVTNNFDESIWNNESGYENNGNAVFNEYMTWAVYDIFLQKYFPKYAKEIGLNWSFQNDSRGFLYAQLFTQKLLSLYNQKENNEKIKDLYPKMLKWSSEIQKDLSKPDIISPKDSVSTNFSNKTKITILFSEPMKKVDSITTILQDGKNLREFIDLNQIEHDLKWKKDGLSVEFEINLPDNQDTYYLQFNWWGTRHPIISKKGVLLKSGSYFKIIDE
jgi:Domain of unknown function (DUF4932)